MLDKTGNIESKEDVKHPLLDQAEFFVACAVCGKGSKKVRTDSVVGKYIVDVIDSLGFCSRTVESGEGKKCTISYCSQYHKWRHGKRYGIHRWLNKIGL